MREHENDYWLSDQYIREALTTITAPKKGMICKAHSDAAWLHPYQRELVDGIRSLHQKQPVVAAEVFCGAGKTRIGFACATDDLRAGRDMLFVSPHRIAFPGFADEFRTGLAANGMGAVGIGLGAIDPENRIHVVTPYDLAKLSETDIAAFQRTARNVGIAVLDEVHRYPHDPNATTRIIGKIEPLVRGEILAHGGKVLTLTATHFRADGLVPFNTTNPDFRISLRDLIRMGMAPPLHGIPIPLEVDVRGTSVEGDTIQLQMGRKDLCKYLDKIAQIVMQVRAKDPRSSHCLFVSRRSHATELCRLLNIAIGKERFVALTSDIHASDRSGIVDRLKSGDLEGYATVHLGAESLNVPRLQYCHLISRMSSPVKIAQCVGRVTRMSLGKDRCVVVDYQVLKPRVLCLAMGLKQIVELGGGTPNLQSGIGGSLFDDEEEDPVTDVRPSLGEYEGWIDRMAHPVPEPVRKAIQELLAIAASGAPRPLWKSDLGIRLRNYTCKTSTSFQSTFNNEVRKLRPDWFSAPITTREGAEAKKKELLYLASKGDKKPTDDTPLGRALHRYLTKSCETYDKQFEMKIRTLRPDWFGPKPVNLVASDAKAEVRRNDEEFDFEELASAMGA